MENDSVKELTWESEGTDTEVANVLSVLESSAFQKNCLSDKEIDSLKKHPQGYGALVFATSGTGKTHHAQKGLWVDGDMLVEWPHIPRFWEVMPRWEQCELGITHLKTIMSYANKYKCLVAFNPNLDSLRLMLNDLRLPILIWLPEWECLKLTLSARTLKQGGLQPGLEAGFEGLMAWTNFAESIRCRNIKRLTVVKGNANRLGRALADVKRMTIGMAE
jgi:hypothetical protein